MADYIVSLRRRPLSVWILCVINGLAAVFLIATAILAELRGYTSAQAAYYGFFGLAISVAAHTTWFGYRWGRLALVLFLTVFLGLTIAYSLWVISWGLEIDYVGEPVRTAFLRVGLSLVWLALNYIFLFGKRARMFFA
jgi:hypothetical protein